MRRIKSVQFLSGETTNGRNAGEGRGSLVTPLFVYAFTPLWLRSEAGLFLIRQPLPLLEHLVHLLLDAVIFFCQLAQGVCIIGRGFELRAQLG